MFEKVGADAKAADALRGQITQLRNKLYTATAEEAAAIKQQIAQLEMQLAAAGEKLGR